VLEYQTSPLSFFAPSTKRPWRSAAGNFPNAASADSRVCALTVAPENSNETIPNDNNQRLIFDSNLFFTGNPPPRPHVEEG
jgi:hypothetical protein